MSTNLIEEPKFEILPPDVATASTELSCPAEKVAALYAPFEKPFQAAADLLAEEEKATNAADARALRLRMVKARTTITATKDESKSDIKLAGNIIDWFHNKGRDRLAAAEARLLDIEKAEERAEAARIQSLQDERAETLASMGHDWVGMNLGILSDDAWHVYLKQAQDIHEMKQIRAKREAEEAAAEMKRQEEEREAARLETIRLREEAEAAAAALAAERAEQAKRDEAAKAEREAAEKAHREEVRKANEAAEIARQKANAEIVKQQAAAKAEREKIEAAAAEERRKALEAAAKETAKREKAEAEAKALRDAEAKRIADAKAADAAQAKADAAAAKKAAAAPDKQRLLEFAIAVRNLPVPPVKSEVANEVRDDITAKLESFAKWIEATVSVL